MDFPCYRICDSMGFYGIQMQNQKTIALLMSSSEDSIVLCLPVFHVPISTRQCAVRRENPVSISTGTW